MAENLEREDAKPTDSHLYFQNSMHRRLATLSRYDIFFPFLVVNFTHKKLSIHTNESRLELFHHKSMQLFEITF